MTAGTLMETPTTDGPAGGIPQGHAEHAQAGTGDRSMAPDAEGPVADAPVRRRRGGRTANGETRAKRRPSGRPGTAGEGSADQIDHSGRFGTFPDPTELSEELFCSNLGLARKVAWKWAQSTGLGYDDIEAVAMRGLLRGCRKYDPTRINPKSGRPYALSSAVVPFVHGELLHEFRDKPYAVRFPARWREKYGMVMRMLGEHATYPQIGAAVGMDAREVEEMVESMCRPGELHDELHGGDAPEAELDLLTPLMELLRMAWDELVRADQGLIAKWWEATSQRHPFPAGSFQQLDKALARMLGGRRLPQLRQLKLFDIPEVAAVAKRQRRQRRAKLSEVVQLTLAET